MSNVEEIINKLVRLNIRSLKPYSSARDEFKNELSQVQRGAPRVFLDANENSLGSPLNEDYSRYPDPQQRTLKAMIAAKKNIRPEQIFLGNGSDEAIDLLLRAFCEPGQDNLILMPPTYGMYGVQANIHGAEIHEAPLRPDFSPDTAAVKNAINANSKLLFLCSPNNPTGQCLPDDFVLGMLGDFPGLVVLDEAYADFSEKQSWVSRMSEFPRLVVLQTLSKAWGLAGLRVGMAFAHPVVIRTLNKVKYPYNLGAATIRLAENALLRGPEMRARTALLLAGRARLEAGLSRIACVKEVYPSDANFLLVRVTDADSIYQYLCNNGVVVRNRSQEIHCENCLRITVGSPEENERLLLLLSRYSTAQ